jgi:AraC-like DNA-binding protein
MTKEMGQTPIELIDSIKVEYAKRLLGEKSRSIDYVANFLGYEHERSFADWFQKQCGMMPSGYRDQIHEGGGSSDT